MTGRAAVSILLALGIAFASPYNNAAGAGEPTPHRMVAIGDSYSSGEGAPSYSPRTDATGINECHRSPSAYPNGVAAWLGADLNSWACSGATTADVASTAVSKSGAPWDDPAQDGGETGFLSALDRLDIDVAVLTITIGANDVGFSDIIVDCLLGSSSCTDHEAAVQRDLITLEQDLDSLFADITSRLSSASSVLIVGYARVFPDHPHADCDFLPLLPGGTFTVSEQKWANTKTAQLNATLRMAANRADTVGGPRFLFVDAWGSFTDNELCRRDPSTGVPILTSPFLNGVDLANFEHSFHPSASGHEALADRAMAVFGVAPESRDSVVLVDPTSGLWHLERYPLSTKSFYFGDPGDLPLVGDWNCDGTETPGLYRQSDGFVYLRNSNTGGIADTRFYFGDPVDIPLAGDFNGDGCHTVSVYRPSQQRFYIINELGENDGGLGAADLSFLFGDDGDRPVVGDWDGNGTDDVGLHREATGLFYWRNSLTTGSADATIHFGDPGDRFIAGDWGVVDGRDTPAVFRPVDATVYFRHTLSQGIADSHIVWSGAKQNWLPVAGRTGHAN